MTAPPESPALLHRTADFRGVRGALLRDGAALSGLLLSAAGAAGLSTAGPPIVHLMPRDGYAVLLLLDLGHLAVHTIPARDTLLLDVLVPAIRDPGKAVEVFTRKLGMPPARSGTADRG